MNSDDFSQLVERRLDKIRTVLASKGKEYSTKDNKLHNFEKAAIKRHTTREIALQGMLTKHEVSIDDIIAKTANNEFPSREVIDEKIGDIINYYILLEACLVDRLNKDVSKSLGAEYQSKIDAIKIKAEQELKDIRTNPSNLAEDQLRVGDIIRNKKDIRTALVLNFLDKNSAQYYLNEYTGYPNFHTITPEILQKDYELWKEDS